MPLVIQSNARSFDCANDSEANSSRFAQDDSADGPCLILPLAASFSTASATHTIELRQS
jgi:hypothetical protein